MAKVDFRRMKREEYEHLSQLVQKTFRKLKKQRAFSELVEDLLTSSEIVMLGRRIHIAQWLLVGKSCEDVCKKLGAGHTTVYRVDRWLRNQCASYEKIFPSLYWEIMSQIARERRKALPYSFAWIRRKYPLEFLLVNLILDDEETRRRLAE